MLSELHTFSPRLEASPHQHAFTKQVKTVEDFFPCTPEADTAGFFVLKVVHYLCMYALIDFGLIEFSHKLMSKIQPVVTKKKTHTEFVCILYRGSGSGTGLTRIGRLPVEDGLHHYHPACGH